MAKAELGTKRVCPNCGSKYYDLNRDPIVCPSCGTVFVVVVAKTRPAPAAKEPAPKKVEEEVETAEESAEVVSLEEADEEVAETGAVAVETDDDDEIEDDDTDDTFLAAEDEDEDEDVADIIGDVDDDEER